MEGNLHGRAFKRAVPGTEEIRYDRKGHKVGRNDPCPCGSGKKYKNAAVSKYKKSIKSLDERVGFLYSISVLIPLVHLIHKWWKEAFMIVLDYQDRRPLYEQITEKLQMLIIKGVLKENEQMPSVRNLAMELSINPNTIQRAYGLLEQQGYIYPIKGRETLSLPGRILLPREDAASLMTWICCLSRI